MRKARLIRIREIHERHMRAKEHLREEHEEHHEVGSEAVARAAAPRAAKEKDPNEHHDDDHHHNVDMGHELGHRHFVAGPRGRDDHHH